MADTISVWNVLLIIFAVIGVIAVLAVVGMSAMHYSLMGGMRFC
ncbi:hypothetical protein [Paralcaligenes ureilyticus]|uniref:Uncharacterized protein n=1 Tax=Paralcaligenes ureilyticus TaxID=627131 RepID=A0A4R3M1S2_9BURK|nr:hypothetical protein [Paralcaligenes ureilyticus]TCT07030.1 hypothetical protein EDC26_10786 [Paralcaligenes ureilyticus]